MSPVIKNANGEPIYGYKNLDSATVIANGMASYTTDLSKASRAGSNPLVVKAVGLDTTTAIQSSRSLMPTASSSRTALRASSTARMSSLSAESSVICQVPSWGLFFLHMLIDDAKLL